MGVVLTKRQIAVSHDELSAQADARPLFQPSGIISTCNYFLAVFAPRPACAEIPQVG
jgi:hypothetical protein